MRAPANLSPAARTAHREAVAAVRASGRDPEAVAGGVRRFALACGRLELVREASTAQGGPVTTAGSRGQLAPHPLLGELRALEAHVDSMAERLGVVMAPPTRAGWPVGNPRAPDRRPRGALVALTDRLRADDAG